jgi:hypothetical protein
MKKRKRHGKGVCLFSDGELYSGEWVDDKPNGSGVLLNSRGEVIDGKFKDGEVTDGKIKILVCQEYLNLVQKL